LGNGGINLGDGLISDGFFALAIGADTGRGVDGVAGVANAGAV